MDIIKSIEHEQMKNKIPTLKVGDTVKVHVRVKEGNRERIQVFEGIIIKIQGGGVNQSFTVRRISYGVGVEKTFLIHSPTVEKVEVVRVGKARRARLFYLRDRIGKAAKTKEQVGARIETLETIIKEEVAEEPAVEEAVEQPVQEEVAPVEETVEAPVAEEPVQEVVDTPVEETVVEAPVAEESAVEETTVEQPAEENVEEKPVAEATEEAVQEEVTPVEETAEAPVESAPEEAPAVETTEVETQEVVDTVSEETVEEIKPEE